MSFLRVWTTAAALGLVGSGVVLASFADSSYASTGPVSVPAPADSTTPAATTKAEVMVLYASNDGSGIDKTIGDHPELKKPPFSSYNSYKQLDRFDLALTQDTASTKVLPDTNTLSVTYKGKAKESKKNETPRFDVMTSIQKPDGSDVLPGLEVTAKQGEFFFVGGEKYKDGALVIGIRIK